MGVPAKGINRHNPPLDEADWRGLSEIRWERRTTWRKFYNWATPILKKAQEEEAKVQVKR